MTNEPETSPGLFPAERAQPLRGDICDYAVHVLNRGGHILSCNPVAEKLTGYTACDVVGEHFSVLYPVEDRHVGVPDKELAAAEAGHHAGEGDRVRKDGSRFRAGVALTPLRNSAGSLVGFANVTHDLTQDEAAEVPLRKLRRVAEALSVRDEFLLDARRELHSAVTSMQMHLRAAIEGIGPPFDEDSAGAIKAKATMLALSLDRATTAMARIVELAKEAAAQLSVAPEPDFHPTRQPVPETD